MYSRHSCQLSDCTPLGTLATTYLDSELRQAIHCRFGMEVAVATMFSRVVVDGVTYHSQAYHRSKRRNSYSVAYDDNGVMKLGFIRYFLNLSSLSIAVITPLSPTENYCYSSCLSVLRESLVPVASQVSLVIVPINCLRGKCVCVSFDGNVYFAKQPNPYFYFE